jgi:WD40 repeat protein
MFKRLALLLFGGLIFAPTVYGQPLAQQRTDSLGDPLPIDALARLGTLRFKHDPERGSTVVAAQFSPDGKKIASLTETIRLWDAATGKPLPGPWNANNIFTALCFSPNGEVLAAACFGNRGPQFQIILWDVAAGKELRGLTGVDEQVGSLAFAEDGKTLISAGNGTVRWWDATTGKQQKKWMPFNQERLPAENGGIKTKSFYLCSLSQDAKFLAVQVHWRQGRFIPPQQNETQEAIGFDLATGKMRWRATGKPKSGEMRFAFSADGNRVAIAVDPNRVELRNAMTGKLIGMPPLDPQYARSDNIFGLALSNDGGTLAVAGMDSHVVLWKPEDSAKFQNIIGRMAQSSSYSTQFITFSPDNTRLLVGADADLQLYDVATLKEVMPFGGHRGWVDYVAFSPDGQRLITGSAQINLHFKEVVTWDVPTWKRFSMTSNRTPLVKNIGFPSPEHTVFTGKNGNARLDFLELATGNLLGHINADPKQDLGARGFFAPGSRLYVLAGKDENGNAIERIYAVPSGRLLCVLPALVDLGSTSRRPIAFSSDERLVALFSKDDGLIHVIDTGTGKERLKTGRSPSPQPKSGGYRGIDDLAFSPDGKYLASSSAPDFAVRVWDLATGKERLLIKTIESINTQGQAPPRKVLSPHFAWSPDSRVLAVGTDNIKLWELATLNSRRDFEGHEGAVRAMAFSPDGQLLASGGSDTTVLIWAVTPAPLVAGEAAAGIEQCWQALAKDDAAKAFAAICDLAATPKDAIAIIQKHVNPAAPADAKHIAELISQLEDMQFKVRQKATTELQSMGEQIVPAIDKALAANPSLETRLRLQELRDRMTGLVLKDDRLQIVRAVEVLERIGSPEARQVLQSLASGAPGALTTAQAGAALERLAKRAAP